MITSSLTKLCFDGLGGSGWTIVSSNQSSWEIKSTQRELNCCSQKRGGPTNCRIRNAVHLRMLTWSINQVRNGISKSASCTSMPSLENLSIKRCRNAGGPAGPWGNSSSSSSSSEFEAGGNPAMGLSCSSLNCDTLGLTAKLCEPWHKESFEAWNCAGVHHENGLCIWFEPCGCDVRGIFSKSVQSIFPCTEKSLLQPLCTYLGKSALAWFLQCLKTNASAWIGGRKQVSGAESGLHDGCKAYWLHRMLPWGQSELSDAWSCSWCSGVTCGSTLQLKDGAGKRASWKIASFLLRGPKVQLGIPQAQGQSSSQLCKPCLPEVCCMGWEQEVVGCSDHGLPCMSNDFSWIWIMWKKCWSSAPIYSWTSGQKRTCRSWLDDFDCVSATLVVALLDTTGTQVDAHWKAKWNALSCAVHSSMKSGSFKIVCRHFNTGLKNGEVDTGVTSWSSKLWANEKAWWPSCAQVCGSPRAIHSVWVFTRARQKEGCHLLHSLLRRLLELSFGVVCGADFALLPVAPLGRPACGAAWGL